MGMEMGRHKNYESKKVTDTSSISDIHEQAVLDVKKMRELIDSLPSDDIEEINEAVDKVKKADMDIEITKEHASSEGEIRLNSDKEEPVVEDSATVEAVQEEKENPINLPVLEFVEYAKSMMKNYGANDYHRMMTAPQINKYVDLYSKAYGVDTREAIAFFEDTVNRELQSDEKDDVGRERLANIEMLSAMTNTYRRDFGPNFMAFLSNEDLEKYSVLYLKSYRVRRNDVNKMYEDSLNKAYADKLVSEMEKGNIDVDGNIISNNQENIDINKSMGFSMIKILALTTFTFIASIGFIAVYFFINK